MEKRVTKSALETQRYATDLAQAVKGGDIFLLYGDLGSGKTTFVQGLAQGLDISQRIISPTFIIMRSYVVNRKALSVKGKELNDVKAFYHIDLYRIQGKQELEGLGLREIMEDKHNIVVIEWPERMENILPKQARKIVFTYINENEREIIYG